MERIMKACLVAVALAVPHGQATADCPKNRPTAASATAQPAFSYRPPNRGAPTQRVGGGTRSITQIEALAPAHVALTTQAMPRLYWHLSPGFRNKLRFRLAEAGVSPPLLEILLPEQPNGGIQFIDLATHNIALEPGRSYNWAIMLEPFPHQRMPPLVSAAMLTRDNGGEQFAQLSPEERPFAAAEQGYWYDAVDWISRLIEQPDAAGVDRRLQRAALLEQGGLSSVASYEREMVSYGQ